MASNGGGMSFSFPGWDFQARDGLAATPAPHDWLEDLDELQGEEVGESNAAAQAGYDEVETEAGAEWLGSAEWPDDIAHAVFSQLDVRALSYARACCVHWKHIASSDPLWAALWAANPRFCMRPAREPCGSVFRVPGSSQPSSFLRYLTMARAKKLYEWVDLQKGWTRLEALLTPETAPEPPSRAPATAVALSSESEVPTAAVTLAPALQPDTAAVHGLCAMGFGRGEVVAALRRAFHQPDRAAELLLRDAESVHESQRRRVEAHASLPDATVPDARVPGRAAEGEAAAAPASAEEETRGAEPAVEAVLDLEAEPVEARESMLAKGESAEANVEAKASQNLGRAEPAPEAETLPPQAGGQAAKRQLARKLGTILAARDWELLLECVLLLQLECAEQLAERVLGPEAVAPATSAAPATSNGAEARQEEADGLLLQRLLWAWRRYASWLDHVSACFAHHQGTPCRSHLACLLAEIRGLEHGTSQHTPSLVHAGYAAFRAAVVLRRDDSGVPRILQALKRHLRHASASVLGHGGFSAESGAAMQQLIDLHAMLEQLDVRDDHLCEERGLRATQEVLRDALLRPLKRIWDEHARSWFCGVKIRPEDQALYIRRGYNRRKGGIIDVE